MKERIICPVCDNLASWSGYFQAYICDSCTFDTRFDKRFNDKLFNKFTKDEEKELVKHLCKLYEITGDKFYDNE